MGTLILLIAVGVEVAFTLFCLATGARHEKARVLIRILEFAVFFLLVLTSILPWSWRWAGLAALLGVWAMRGLWTLRHPAPERGETGTGPLIVRALTALVLIGGALTPALIFPEHEPLPTTGPYGVVSMRATYTDFQRRESFTHSGESRRINAVFWVPQQSDEGETFPLVIFSHGGLGSESSNESLYRELASHGYVVCSIGHPFHALWTESEDGQIVFVDWGYFQEFQREDAKRDKQASFRSYQKWMETRTGDINFVIDTILERAAHGVDGLYARIDGEKIAVMGHSLGGAAALAIPRQRGDIAAVIALESPFLYDIVGVANGEFVWREEVYPVPVLNIYSDSSWSHLGEWAQYAENFDLLSNPSATTSSLHLPGAGHFSLTDLSLASPLLVRLLEGRPATPAYAEYLGRVNSACLDFFDRYLKGRTN